MEFSFSPKTYKAPGINVIEVKVHGVLCDSLNGTFKVSDSDVEKGDDNVWGEYPLW